jgi:ribose/xylose/arabinose/galactoside ABC-type transport system permease subunit
LVGLSSEEEVVMSRNTRKIDLTALLKDGIILWVFSAMCVFLAFLSPSFIKPLNIVTVLKQSSMLGILAIGSTFVLISGGVDLSVGSILAVSGVCAAMLAQKNFSLPLIIPILAAVIVGTGIGLMNGVGVAFGKITPFIMTLGFMISIRGLAFLITKGKPVFGLRDNFTNISNGVVFRFGDVVVPSMVFYLIGVVIIMSVILKLTVFGKWLNAVGGNEEAARFSAISVNFIKAAVYTLNGLLAGLCGVLMASRLNSGDATVAQNFALDAIAASVIGGVSLAGGVGSIWKTIVGALIIGVMQNGLQILGVSPFIQTIVQGLIIIAAVFFDMRGRAKQ